MALTKDDLGKIKNVVDAGTETVNVHIDKLEEKMDARLSEHDRRFDVIEHKIDRLSERTDEDTVAAYEDIDKIKVRLKKAGI